MPEISINWRYFKDQGLHLLFSKPLESTSFMMAAQVYVLDSSARRATIKVTPGKYLTDVLEEACAKLGYKSSNYGLK
jgi:hypothetical protein